MEHKVQQTTTFAIAEIKVASLASITYVQSVESSNKISMFIPTALQPPFHYHKQLQSLYYQNNVIGIAVQSHAEAHNPHFLFSDNANMGDWLVAKDS